MKEVGRLCSSHEDSFAVSQLFGPMSTDRSTFSPDVELLKEASLLSKAVEDIPSQTGETLRVKDEKTILEFNLDHLKAYSLPPSTPPMTPLPTESSLVLPTYRRDYPSKFTFSSSLEFPPSSDYGMNCLPSQIGQAGQFPYGARTMMMPMTPSSPPLPNLFSFPSRGLDSNSAASSLPLFSNTLDFTAKEWFIPFSSTIQPIQQNNYLAAGTATNSFGHSSSDPTHLELLEYLINIECGKRLDGLSAESNQYGSINKPSGVLSDRVCDSQAPLRHAKRERQAPLSEKPFVSQQMVKLQPERDATTVIHLRFDPTANSFLPSAFASGDLVDLTPKISAKELEKVPAKMALQEKRKYSDPEVARPVKIINLANAISRKELLTGNKQVISKSGALLTRAQILSDQTALKMISVNNISSPNQPTSMSGVKAGQKLQIRFGSNRRLEINELNSDRMQHISQELNNNIQFIIPTTVKAYSANSKKSALFPLTQTNPLLKIKSARPTETQMKSVAAQVSSVKTTASGPRKVASKIKETNILASPSAVISTNRVRKVAEQQQYSSADRATGYGLLQMYKSQYQTPGLKRQETDLTLTSSSFASATTARFHLKSSVESSKRSETLEEGGEGVRLVNEPSLSFDGIDDAQSDESTAFSPLVDNLNLIEALDSGTDISSSDDDEPVEMEAVNATGSSTASNRFLPEESVEVLRKWFHNHENNPYPNRDEKGILAKESKLTLSQVGIWFYHERKRKNKREALIRGGIQEKVKTMPTFKQLPLKSVEVLKNWVEKHESDPKALVAAAGLTATQVTSWLSHAKQRKRNQSRPKEKCQSIPHPPAQKLLSLKSAAVLNKWFCKHKDDPYPSYDQKVALAKEAGFDVLQVQKWFTSARESQLLNKMGKSLSNKTSISATSLIHSTPNSNLPYQTIEELEVVPLPESIKDHAYCVVFPKPITSPLRVRPDHSVELYSEDIPEQGKYTDDRQANCDDQSFTCPPEDSSNTDSSRLALLSRTNKEGNLLALVKSVLEENGLNTSDSKGLNECPDKSGALIALCTHQHAHPDFMAVARLMFENGVNINTIDDQCRNSLLFLCMEHLNSDDLFDMTQFLMQNGIDFKGRDKNGTRL